MQLYREDGYDHVQIPKAEATRWVRRIREALRGFEQAMKDEDHAALVEWAHDASGCGGELENIAETTAQEVRDGSK